MVQWVAVICVSAACAFGHQSENERAKGMPQGVMKAMTADEEDFCHQWAEHTERAVVKSFERICYGGD